MYGDGGHCHSWVMSKNGHGKDFNFVNISAEEMKPRDVYIAIQRCTVLPSDPDNCSDFVLCVNTALLRFTVLESWVTISSRLIRVYFLNFLILCFF